MTALGSFLREKSQSIVLLSGWRAIGLSFFAGAVAALGQAPFHFFPVLFFSFPVLVLLLDGASPDPRAGSWFKLFPAFLRGWFFGFGYFTAGLWWLGSAFLVNAQQFLWLLPLGVLVLPALLGIFFGLATSLARTLWTENAHRVLILAASLAFFEWLRSFILTGFPWNHLGYLLAFHEYSMQAIAILGLPVYGFLAVLIPASLVWVLDDTSPSGKSLFQAIRLPAGMLIVLFGFGLLWLEGVVGPTRFVEGVNLRVVQPNINQSDKFKPENAGEILQRHIALSERSDDSGNLGLLSKTHVIWPESAFPFFLTHHPQVLARLGAMLPPGTVLLTGAIRAEPVSASTERPLVYNSVYTIDHNGTITDAYDKVHLVPFGEYIPFENKITAWKKLLEDTRIVPFIELPGGFSSGPSQRMMQATSAPPFLPLVCYEIIFPVKSPTNGDLDQVGWILNVTNDAWFGITTGPYQHFHQTRVRAVSEGLPVVRAANNGISAVIDAYGRTVERLALGTAGTLDVGLPHKAAFSFPRFLQHVLFAILLSYSLLIAFYKVFSTRGKLA